jgi:5-methylthioribose kinase
MATAGLQPTTLSRLTAANAAAYLVARGLLPWDVSPDVEELSGGVSGTVLSVRAPGVALVVKQALPELRVAGRWRAPARRTDTEAAALRLAERLVPGRFAPVVESDPRHHVVVLQHAPVAWRNWQSELLDGRMHAAFGAWAGDTLGRLHAATTGDPAVAAAFGDYEALDLLRLQPFHGAASRRLPHLAAPLAELARELRETRLCLVHGDYAPKNILVGRERAWVIDAEVAHYGHPVFDLAFFLAFLMLNAVQMPATAGACGEIAGSFLRAYEARAAALPMAAIGAHTGAMLLARTDGLSPAAFLDPAAVIRARNLGERFLLAPPADLPTALAGGA